MSKDYDWIHLLDTYKNKVNKNYTVLEIGASNLKRTKDLSVFCKNVIGIESNKKRKPKNFENVKYLLGDWQKLTKIIPANSVDLAVSSHTIEHVLNDLKAINELYKVLKPNGCAIINTPNRKRFIRSLIEIFTGPKKFPNWEHIREYSYLDINNLLKKSNFKKYKITPVAFGIHSIIKFYIKRFPSILNNYANFWEIVLFK